MIGTSHVSVPYSIISSMAISLHFISNIHWGAFMYVYINTFLSENLLLGEKEVPMEMFFISNFYVIQ